MRAPCTVRASRPTSQYQDVTCNPGAPSRSGQYLLLRHVHTPDWQTVGLQQKHAALPGFVFPCFFLSIFQYLLFFLLFFFVFSKTFFARSTSTFSQSSSLLSVSAGCSRSVFLFWRKKNILIYLQFGPFPQTLALLDISALEYIGKIFTLLQVLL